MKVVFLAVCLGLAAAYPAEYNPIDAALGHIRNYLNTDEGLEVARDYIRSLEVKHPIVFMVKAFLDSASDITLKELLNDLLADIPTIETTSDVDVHDLLHQFAEYMRTDQGLTETIQYFKDLKPQTIYITKLKDMVVAATPEALREVIDSILPGSSLYYAADDDLRVKIRSLFHQIRTILTTSEGIQVVRDYARALEPSHPALFLVKAFIQSAADDVLLEILDELFKNLSNDYSTGYVSKQLEDLFLQLREILKTDEGFAILKEYVLSIKSEHPIVSRVVQFMSQASDDTLLEILDALFGDVFFF